MRRILFSQIDIFSSLPLQELVISGLLVYIILNAILVPFKTSLLTGAVISVLTFGLACYYVREQRYSASLKIGDHDEKEKQEELKKTVKRPAREPNDRRG